MIDIKVNVSTQPIEQYSQIVRALLPGIVKKHAINIQGKAAKKAPVDTGALQNSIIAEEKEPLKWEITDGVEYGAAQELGTSRGVPAKHFLGSSCEEGADAFFDDIREALKG